MSSLIQHSLVGQDVLHVSKTLKMETICFSDSHSPLTSVYDVTECKTAQFATR